MSAQTRIVERWRARLAESRQRVAECPAHRRWVHQIYARIYQFLISCYGIGEWRTDEDADRSPDVETSHMEFVDNTVGEHGARPKSAERIRATLDAVHEARGNAPSPGQRGSLEYADWIAVASQSGAVSPKRFIRLLRLNDIESRQVRRGDDVIVEVYAGRREEAMELLERHRAELRLSRRRGLCAMLLGPENAHSGGIAGAVLGIPWMLLVVGIIDSEYSLRTSPRGGLILWSVFAVGWISCILVGAIWGAVMGRRNS